MTEFGDSTVLETREVETPKPKPGEILIRIEAAGLNRLDHYIREGGVNPDISFPFILGSDAVGTVAELGEGVTGFEIGERVIPMPGYPIDPKEDGGQVMSASKSYLIRGIAENGSYAQYMTAQISDLTNGFKKFDGLIRIKGYVTSAPDFTDQATVLNAASKLFTKYLGEKGRHARAAFSVTQLPLNSPLELTVTFAAKKMN